MYSIYKNKISTLENALKVLSRRINSSRTESISFELTKEEIEAKLTGEINSHTHVGASGGLTQQQILRLV